MCSDSTLPLTTIFFGRDSVIDSPIVGLKRADTMRGNCIRVHEFSSGHNARSKSDTSDNVGHSWSENSRNSSCTNRWGRTPSSMLPNSPCRFCRLAPARTFGYNVAASFGPQTRCSFGRWGDRSRFDPWPNRVFSLLSTGHSGCASRTTSGGRETVKIRFCCVKEY